MNFFRISILSLLVSGLLKAAPFLVVTTTDDEGAGSLRQVLSEVDDGGLVTFDDSLKGQVITLTSGYIELDQSVTVDATGIDGDLSISGEEISGVFVLNSPGEVVLKSIKIENTYREAGVTVAGGGKVTMENCSILNGSAIKNGGGVHVGDAGTLEMNECLLEGNSGELGGGVYNDGVMEIRGCTFRSNEGREDGGGLYSRGNELVRDCLFVGNNAREKGGAMWMRRDTYMEGCTIVENEADDGGGIYCTEDLDMNYCTIVRNVALSDYGAFYAIGPIGLGNCVISDNVESSDRTEITDQLMEDSRFCYFEGGAPLDELADYGGPTQTLRPTAGGAGLIDLADPDPAILLDARGEPRMYGEASDIGAVEFQGGSREEFLATPKGDPDGDGVETLLELALGMNPLVADSQSDKNLKIERLGNTATISFGVDPEWATEIEMTLMVSVGVEGLEVLLTNEEIRALPLVDGVAEYDLVLDARVKFYRMDVLEIVDP